MRALLIRLLILPRGLSSINLFCLLALVVLHLPAGSFDSKTSQGGDEFPGRRRGGGSHWVQPGSSTV
ncbi:MAG: hypothetical protein ICV62_09350 [Cyanobacteria bacterium Co-bin13]|nr:hypothetical protein [Cyanobacteria bacterium Co-bin13]